MDIFAAYATDESKEEDGVRIFLVEGKEDPDVDPWIRVARMGNSGYNKEIIQRHGELTAAKKAEKLTEDQFEIRTKNSMTEAMAKTILKGFGNLEFQGTKLTPGYEANLQLLRVKDFRELVATHAMNVELFRLENVQAASGN